jgi:hypothetical protein
MHWGVVMGGLTEGAVLAPLLAAGVFAAYFVKHVTEALARRKTTALKAERLICALYAEIKANADDLARFVAASPPLERVKQAVRDNPSFRPHFTNAPHRTVYGSHITELASLPRQVILNVVAFYCQLDRLSELTYGLERPSFESISPEGREQVMAELWQAVERGLVLGREVMHGLEIHAPLELTRGALKPVG